MKNFWDSAPLKVVQKELGFTKEGVVAVAQEQLARAR
jgi:transketolase